MTAWWGREESLLDQVRTELALLRRWVDSARPTLAPPLEVDVELISPAPGLRSDDAEFREIEEFVRRWIDYELTGSARDGVRVRAVVRPVLTDVDAPAQADVRLTRGGQPVPGQRPRIARSAGEPARRAAAARIVFRHGSHGTVEATYDLADSSRWIPIGRDLPQGIAPWYAIGFDRQLATVPTGHWMSLQWHRGELRLRRTKNRPEYRIELDGVPLYLGQERSVPTAGRLRFHRADQSSDYPLEYHVETGGR